jgi:starch synthase
MDTLHIASELAPIAKIGGLGDVTLGLPLELARSSFDIAVLIPKYDVVDLKPLKGLKREASFEVQYDKKTHRNTLFSARLEGLKVFLIEEHSRRRFFRRGEIYGAKDDSERFLYFNACALEAIKYLSPRTIHLHDWHTSLLAALCPKNMRSVLTIHNPAYQGIITLKQLEKLTDLPLPHTWKVGKNLVSLLRAGIDSAEFVTTVSPQFAKEMQAKKDPWGLRELLKAKGRHFKGILNGIDYTIWNPTADPYIKAKAPDIRIKSAASSALNSFIRAKKANKRDLQKSLNLKINPNLPIVACITRLVEQKGLHLIEHAIRYTIERGGQFVLLGSRASEKTLKTFKKLRKRLAPSHQAYLQFHHSEKLAHKIFAGSDLFVIPSLFEPCGITQMIAMRFGTIPLARRTGGLADSVIDFKDHTHRPKERNGFTFEKPSIESLEKALDRAFDVWKEKPTQWSTLIENALGSSFDWSRSAVEYIKLYKTK